MAKVGKRVMWYFSKKVNRLFLHAAWKSAILTFASITQNDANEATKIWYEIGKGAGDSLMYAWLDRAKMLFSKKLEDMKIIVESAWHSFLGDTPDKIEFFEAFGNEVPKVVWQFNKCWICAEVMFDEDLKHLDFKNNKYGYAAAASGIFEAALQMVIDYVDNPYCVVVNETKCFLRGDSCQEFTAYFYPKENIQEKLE